MFEVFADGASRGNPGPASYGAVIYKDGVRVATLSKKLGTRTNNFAEYSAVIAAFEWIAQEFPNSHVSVKMDSKLVIEQLSGRWQIKHPELRELAKQAFRLMNLLSVELQWIPREQNYEADAAANTALDESDVATETSSALASVQPKSVRAPRQTLEPTVIVLIRHGHTISTESGLISGSNDDPSLSKLGLREARAAGQEVPRLLELFGLPEVEHVYHSDMARATETALEVAMGSSAMLTPDSRLREISFGDWERVSMSDVERMAGQAVEAWRGSMTVKPPGGESLVEFEERVFESLAEIVRAHEGGSAAIVAHMMPLRAVTRKALGAAASTHWAIQFVPASISVFRFFGMDFAEVYSINSCQHLLEQ